MAFTLPKTITPGQNENASDVQANDAAIRDELNGVTTVSDVVHKSDTSAQSVAGNFTVAGTLATSKGDVEPAFSGYKLICASQASVNNAIAQTYLFGAGTGTVVGGFATTASAGGAAIFYLDPADFTAGSRTNYWRIRAACFTNATAPGMTFTVGLYPVSAVAGGAGVLAPTLGTVTTGSTVAFTTQGASTRAQGNSGDFAAPSAGYYVLGVAASGGQAANSAVSLSAQLQYRQV